MKTILLSYFLVLLYLSSFQARATEEGAKAIFQSGEGPTVTASSYSDTSEETKKIVAKKKTNTTVAKVEKYMGISYWIELLNGSGERKKVTAASTFKSGDRIKLLVESNRDGYLYVINVGSTGRSHVLFPNSGVSSNFVSARVPYEVPYNTYMRFDNNPGEELLLVMLSPKPIGDRQFVPVLNNEGTRYYTKLAQAKGAKDIVLEDEPAGINPASYAVAPISSLESGMITLKIKLRHR